MEPTMIPTAGASPNAEVIREKITKIVEESAKKYADDPEELDIPTFPEADPRVFYGLAGQYVELVSPHTEADPMALLSHFLAFSGNIIGRGARVRADGATHCPNLFVVNVGRSSRARKGTARERVSEFFLLVDSSWYHQRVLSGLSSGEGLIEAVKDTDEEDENPVDKRLLILEGEFGGVLRILRREGNILSKTLRDAWDGKRLMTLTRKDNRLVATNAHISIIGHITQAELLRYLDAIEIFSGFANRFLWVAVQRAKVLPIGSDPPALEIRNLAQQVKKALTTASRFGEIRFSAPAAELWSYLYHKWSKEERVGLLATILQRVEAQVLRLSLLYALLDEKPRIEPDHIQAAEAFWRYCEDSAVYIFGGRYGDSDAEKLIKALKKAGPDGLTQTEIYRNVFGGNVKAGRIKAALYELQAARKIKVVKEKKLGRRTITRYYYAC